MVEQILAALFVIGLLLASVWLMRRKGLAVSNVTWRRAPRSSNIQLVERLQLTAQHSLHLVRFGNELILIGVSPESCAQIGASRAALPQAEMRPAI